MEKGKIEISIPQDIMDSLNKSSKELSDEIGKMMSIELYNTKKLSLGKCADYDLYST